MKLHVSLGLLLIVGAAYIAYRKGAFDKFLLPKTSATGE